MQENTTAETRDEFDVDDVESFCHANRISRPFYYKLKKQGKGPREMVVGRRRLITKEAGAEWRASLEKGAACG